MVFYAENTPQSAASRETHLKHSLEVGLKPVRPA